VNAIKHTAPGGSVKMNVVHDMQHRKLLLRIIDTGEGIAAEDLSRLFQKYGRVAGQTLGRKYDTGLGLVFCRMAIELLHGSINVESEVGKGTTFIIELNEY
jgi:signal transduction histidine kinase